MNCCCLKKLGDLIAALKNAPLAMLLGMIPPMPALPQLGGLASGLGTASMFADAKLSAALAAAIKLQMPALPAAALSLMAKLEAMAAIKMTTGINMLSASANAQLAVTAGSFNANFPSLLAMMMEMLAPLLAPLLALLEMASAVGAINANLGINMLAPGAGAALSAKLSAMASASMNAAVSANIGALGNLAMAARLAAASAALGIDLTAAGGMAALNAALKLAASLKIPALAIPVPQLGSLAAMLSALTASSASLGVNLMLPSAAGLLKAALAALLGNLAAAANVAASASLAATASLGSQLNAVVPALSMNLSALASMKMSAMAAVGLPNLMPMSMMGQLAAEMNLATGVNVMSSSACSSCSFL